MFDLVTKYKRVIQVFLGLIALTFATWGIESYTRFRGAGDAVASVNGMKISQREFTDELRRQQDQVRKMFGRAIDPAALDTPGSRRTLLDSLIAQRLVASAALRGNLTVTDETLRDTIRSIPAFQDGGQFSKSSYELVLRSQNPPMSPAQFESRLRYDLSLQQLARAVGDSAIAPRAVAQRLSALESQKREVADARILTQQFLSEAKIDEAKLKAHYDANQADFRTPERVRAEYVVLSAELLARQELLAELKESPGRFAELANKRSQDPGSAAKGGDLGWFGRGMMVKPFDEAVFKLKQNELQIVQSEFGYHVVRLTGIQSGKSRPLEEVRKELSAELARQKGAKKFAEAAENFSNLVYEQPDSLKPAAERFKLPVQSTGWIAKSASQELGALDNPKLLAALFSQDSIKNKRNTDAIEVGPSTLVAARVVEYQPAAQRSFEQVSGEIADLLRRREATALAEKDGAAKLEQLRKGGDAGVKWSAPRTVSRRDAQGLPAEVLRRIVAADVSKLPAYLGMPVPETGYLLVRISKVMEAEAKPAEQQAADAGRASQMFGAAQYDAYVSSLRSRADIDISNANLERK